MAKIRYIGKKRRKLDTVAGTGLEWTPGEVHDVNPALAGKLLAHRDVWALADESEMTDQMRAEMTKMPNAHILRKADDTIAEGEVEDFDDLTESEQLDLDENDALPNITRMNRENLNRLGKSRFGEDFSEDMPLDEIRDRIVTLQNARKRMT